MLTPIAIQVHDEPSARGEEYSPQDEHGWRADEAQPQPQGHLPGSGSAWDTAFQMEHSTRAETIPHNPPCGIQRSLRADPERHGMAGPSGPGFSLTGVSTQIRGPGTGPGTDIIRDVWVFTPGSSCPGDDLP